MFKMEIALDEQKILQDGKYAPEDISKSIDKLFSSLRIEKQGDGLYSGGAGGDFAGYGNAILFLKEKTWFMSYVDKWLWYNSKGSNHVEDFQVEDLAAHYKSKVGMRS